MTINHNGIDNEKKSLRQIREDATAQARLQAQKEAIDPELKKGMDALRKKAR